MNDSIITTSTKEVSLSTKFLRLESSVGGLIVDIKGLLAEPIHSENAYFNATRILEQYNKSNREANPNAKEKDLSNFLRSPSTKEYISILEEEFNNNDSVKNTQSKKAPKVLYVKRGRETSKTKGTFGTYMHKELFLKFAGWLNTRFEREMHKLITNLIIHSDEIKADRESVKFKFKGLTSAIKDIYIPAQTSESSIKFAYSHLATLLNLKVLGMTATKYAKINNIKVEDGKTIRDYISKDLINEFTEAEEELHAYIKYIGVTDYAELKSKMIS